MTQDYIEANMLESCSAKLSGGGYFIPQAKSPLLSPWLLSSVSGKQIAIHIAAGPNQFTFSDLSKAISDLPGILLPEVIIEVDPHTSFNATTVSGRLGSLVFNAGVASIIAMPIGGTANFDDERVGFDVAPIGFTTATGFTDWRLVVQTAGGPKVLWSHEGSKV